MAEEHLSALDKLKRSLNVGNTPWIQCVTYQGLLIHDLSDTWSSRMSLSSSLILRRLQFWLQYSRVGFHMNNDIFVIFDLDTNATTKQQNLNQYKHVVLQWFCGPFIAHEVHACLCKYLSKYRLSVLVYVYRRCCDAADSCRLWCKWCFSTTNNVCTGRKMEPSNLTVCFFI